MHDKPSGAVSAGGAKQKPLVKVDVGDLQVVPQSSVLGRILPQPLINFVRSNLLAVRLSLLALPLQEWLLWCLALRRQPVGRLFKIAYLHAISHA
jgi:hypothetical protein